MHTVLVVSPHFPPINAPDMQRVRMSLPYFEQFGWQPLTLAVHAADTEGVRDPLLEATLPKKAFVHSVHALPVRLTRRIGVGTLALRALPFLYLAGSTLIRRHAVSLVYFSTTLFPVMALGRIWRSRYGVPFVLDMQDPWFNDYYERNPGVSRPPKYWLAQNLHRSLEAWTMCATDGLIAVSATYIHTLHERYPLLAERPALTLPFGADIADQDVVRAHPQPNRFFQPGDGLIHAAYVGRLGPAMVPALQMILHAVREGLARSPQLFGRLRLHFIGTDYATDARARKTAEPLAQTLGIAACVAEHTGRIPYFEALHLLHEADMLIVPGSDDPGYTASKIYPYILAQRPLLAVVHAASSVVTVLRETGAGEVVTLNPHTTAMHLSQVMEQMLARLPYTPVVNWQLFEPYTAIEMTRQQCALFDQVVNNTAR